MVVSDALVDPRELPTGRILNPLWSCEGLPGAAGGERVDSAYFRAPAAHASGCLPSERMRKKAIWICIKRRR